MLSLRNLVNNRAKDVTNDHARLSRFNFLGIKTCCNTKMCFKPLPLIYYLIRLAIITALLGDTSNVNLYSNNIQLMKINIFYLS